MLPPVPVMTQTFPESRDDLTCVRSEARAGSRPSPSAGLGDLRFDLQYIIEKLDEWSWGFNGVPWVYSDGTTVSLNPDQRVTFAALRYIYKF